MPIRNRQIAVVLIMVTMLACGLDSYWSPSRPTPGPSQSYLTDIKIDIFTGGNVHVLIQDVRGEEVEATLTCNYPNGKGGIGQ